MDLLDQTATAVAEEQGVDLAQANRAGPDRNQSSDQKRLTLAVISAQRKALMDARDGGSFSADALNAVLAILDADQISLELKGAPTNHRAVSHQPSAFRIC